MKVLAVADVEERALWECYSRERVRGIEAIISCGDLHPDYLDFLVSMTNVPLFYVRGNHDLNYDKNPPAGGICIDGRALRFDGLRIMGLGGCMKYREGPDVYTEAAMRRRIRRMVPSVCRMRGIDLFVTHAPVKGYGDLDDLPHRGFEAFQSVLEHWKPSVMIHGHVHMNYGTIKRERLHPCGTKIINVSGFQILDL